MLLRVVAGESDPRRRAARTRPGSAATGDAGRSSVQCRSVCSGQLRRLTGHDLRSADASGSAAVAATERRLLPGAADRMVSNAGACSAVSTAGLGQGAYGTEDLVAAEGFGGSGRSEASGRSPSARRAGNIVFGQSSRRAGRSSRAREGTRGNSAQRLCDGVVEGGRPALSGGVVVKVCQEGAFPRCVRRSIRISATMAVGNSSKIQASCSVGEMCRPGFDRVDRVPLVPRNAIFASTVI